MLQLKCGFVEFEAPSLLSYWTNVSKRCKHLDRLASEEGDCGGAWRPIVPTQYEATWKWGCGGAYLASDEEGAPVGGASRRYLPLLPRILFPTTFISITFESWRLPAASAPDKYHRCWDLLSAQYHISHDHDAHLGMCLLHSLFSLFPRFRYTSCHWLFYHHTGTNSNIYNDLRPFTNQDLEYWSNSSQDQPGVCSAPTRRIQQNHRRWSEVTMVIRRAHASRQRARQGYGLITSLIATQEHQSIEFYKAR